MCDAGTQLASLWFLSVLLWPDRRWRSSLLEVRLHLWASHADSLALLCKARMRCSVQAHMIVQQPCFARATVLSVSRAAGLGLSLVAPVQTQRQQGVTMLERHILGLQQGHEALDSQAPSSCHHRRCQRAILDLKTRYSSARACGLS